MSTDTANNETGQRIRLLHDWYCAAMGTPLRLTMQNERLWFDWIQEGFNGQQLRKVMNYLRREIEKQRRNPGALKLSNLLQTDKFAEDLVLCSARLDPEVKLPPSPLSERTK